MILTKKTPLATKQFIENKMRKGNDSIKILKKLKKESRDLAR
jgi:hypothetical protein